MQPALATRGEAQRSHQKPIIDTGLVIDTWNLLNRGSIFSSAASRLLCVRRLLSAQRNISNQNVLLWVSALKHLKRTRPNESKLIEFYFSFGHPAPAPPPARLFHWKISRKINDGSIEIDMGGKMTPVTSRQPPPTRRSDWPTDGIHFRSKINEK